MLSGGSPLAILFSGVRAAASARTSAASAHGLRSVLTAAEFAASSSVVPLPSSDAAWFSGDGSIAGLVGGHTPLRCRDRIFTRRFPDNVSIVRKTLMLTELLAFSSSAMNGQNSTGRGARRRRRPDRQVRRRPGRRGQLRRLRRRGGGRNANPFPPCAHMESARNGFRRSDRMSGTSS